MKKIGRFVLAGAAFCLLLGLVAAPVLAQAASSSHKHHHHKAHAKPKPSERVRRAQNWLIKLGYNPGSADGFMGPRTKSAIVAFERDHNMHEDGKLTDKIYDLLNKEAEATKAAEAASTPHEDFFATHPDFYGYTAPDYSNPTVFNSPQPVPTRFGDLQISETKTGLTRAYTVTLNNQPVFHTEGQPSAINASRTFSVGDADAIIVTSYAPGDSVCPYRHSLLIVRAAGGGAQDINDCSRAYRASMDQGSLYIAFPGPHVDGWSSGDLWRFDGGRLERL
jgi:hypothetical protein